MDIPTIFEFEGQEGFRDREQKMIQQLTKLDGIVLATGGGAILREENRRLLKENGFIVYLQCSVERILERTRRDAQRLLLKADNPKERIEKLFVEREHLYLSCADFIIDPIMQSKAVVSHILEEYDPQIVNADEKITGRVRCAQLPDLYRLKFIKPS